MDLSIIIPFFNSENYILQCITSITNQNLPIKDYEIILINDGSTDMSNKIVSQLIDKFSNIKLITQKNSGLSASRNKGLSLSQGNYIFFMDSDDYLALNTLSHLLKIVDKNDLDMLEFSYTQTKLRDIYNTHKALKDVKFEVLEGKDYIATRNYLDYVWVYLYRRSFLLNSKVKFIEGKIMEDTLFNAELIPKAKRIAYYPLDVVRYVDNPNSLTNDKKYEAKKKMINDHVFMAVKYSDLIKKLNLERINTKVLKRKQQYIIFSILKNLLDNNFKFHEINPILSTLTEQNLYPLKPIESKSPYKKLISIIVKNKYTFFIFFKFYRKIMQKPMIALQKIYHRSI